mgnify:CR=1 FL=1
MSRTITSRTRLFALLGDPVSHSFSPVIQNAAMRDLELDGAYVALRSESPEELAPLMRGLARAGGGGNITLPHKEKAATVLDVPSADVRRTGACNTFWFQDGEIHGDNTDVEGFGRALGEFLGGTPDGYRVLVIGAGGSARACLVALMDGGVEEIQLLNRSRDRARAVARRIGGERVRVLDDRMEVAGKSFDLVVNTTRLGLDPEDPLPLELDLLDRAGAVVDLIYGAGTTPFVTRARDLGIRASDGSEMLVHQGAVAFERWWGEKPSVEVMRAALHSFQNP